MTGLAKCKRVNLMRGVEKVWPFHWTILVRLFNSRRWGFAHANPSDGSHIALCVFPGMTFLYRGLVYMSAQLFSHIWLSATPPMVAQQALWPVELSWQEYWSRLPFPTAGESSQPRDWTQISCISCIGRQTRYNWAIRESLVRDLGFV